jgi:hypothetical protein
MRTSAIAAVIVTSSLQLLCGCGVPNNHASITNPATERAVAEFHEKLNKADFKGIYAASHPRLKKATSESDFVARLDAIHQKLGMVQATDPSDADFGVWIDKRPVQIDATYSTKFATGEATETFTLLMEGKSALLSDYKIDAPALK